MRAKKSQSEIMGLMIVVVLISLIILFVVKTVFFKETTQHLEKYQRGDLTTSMPNALFESHSGCQRTTFQELLIDCAENYPSGSIECSDEIKSCEYLNQNLQPLLQNTLNKWGISYRFTMRISESEPLIEFEEKITEPKRNQIMKTNPFYLTSNIGMVVINLYVW